MKVATAAQSVEVTGEVPVLNTAESRNQMTLETAALSNLPLAGRNMISLVTHGARSDRERHRHRRQSRVRRGQLLDGVTGGCERQRRGQRRKHVHGGWAGCDQRDPPGRSEPDAQSRFGPGNQHSDQHLQRGIRPGQLSPDGDDHEIRHRRLPWHRQRLLHQPEALGRHGVRSQVLSVPQQQRLRHHRRADHSAPPILLLLRD